MRLEGCLEVFKFLINSVSVEVEKWMRKKMEKIGGSSLQTLPIILVDGKFPAAALGLRFYSLVLRELKN